MSTDTATSGGLANDADAGHQNDEFVSAVTVFDLLLGAARDHHDRVALIDGDTRIDYRALVAAALQAGRRLADRGIGAGDRVGILLPNSWQYAVAYFGAQSIGAVTVLINTRFTAPEVAHVCRDSGTRIVVTDADLGTLVEDAPTVHIDEIASLSLGAPAHPIEHAGGSDGVAQLLYTSGTTGHPKGVMQLHSNLIFNARTVRERLGAAPGERTLIAAPMFHAIGIVSQLVGFTAAGATCVIMPAFDAVKAVRLIAEEKVTIFAGVASMLRLIMLKAQNLETELASLSTFVMGGSPVPGSLLGDVRAQLPKLRVANVWGLTEATSIATFTEGEDFFTHPESAGKPLDGVEVRVVVDGGAPQDLRDVDGELCVRGPIVAGGYWGNDSATASTFVDGWLHTGDVGRIDSDGHVYVRDRLKDMIIRGGENVYSLEVENALITHPAVAEVAVVGIADDVLGERVCAIVVADGSDVSAEDLRSHARVTLADFKTPSEIVFVSELPRNASGKVLKRRLVDAGRLTVGGQ